MRIQVTNLIVETFVTLIEDTSNIEETFVASIKDTSNKSIEEK